MKQMDPNNAYHANDPLFSWRDVVSILAVLIVLTLSVQGAIHYAEEIDSFGVAMVENNPAANR